MTMEPKKLAPAVCARHPGVRWAWDESCPDCIDEYVNGTVCHICKAAGIPLERDETRPNGAFLCSDCRQLLAMGPERILAIKDYLEFWKMRHAINEAERKRGAPPQ